MSCEPSNQPTEVLLTYIKIPFEIGFSVTQFVSLKVWFHIGDLNVRFIWIQSIDIHKI